MTAYNDLKLSKKHKFIIFKLSDDNKEIVIEETSSDGDWEVFRDKLVNATVKKPGVRSFRLSFHLFSLHILTDTGHGQGPQIRGLRLRVQPFLGRGCPVCLPLRHKNCALPLTNPCRNKLTFLAWSPDDAPIKAKMVYASSKEALKRALTGIAVELQANDTDDIEYDTILKTVSKGMA